MHFRFTPWVALVLLATMPTGAQETVTPKVIYGPDDRLDVYQVSDPDILSWAASTCAVVSRFDLDSLGNGTYEADTTFFNACAGEPFGNQRTLANCSAFLVGTDLVATAGHCISESELTRYRFVFGFQMLNATTQVNIFDQSQVYTGVQIVGRALTALDDWAVVRLDRDVTAPGAVPLAIRRDGFPGVGTPVGIIGHPTGLPMKIAFGSTTVVKKDFQSAFFESNLDAYGGNSGSPVFNQLTGIVEGILVRGQTDYQPGLGCYASNVLSDSNGQGGEFEECSRTTRFDHLVPFLAPGGPGDVNGDGFANAADLQLVINVVLGINVNENADINDDGFFNAIDIQALILLLQA